MEKGSKSEQRGPWMNHFVAFRVCDPEVLQNIQFVQDQMMSTSVKVIRKGKLEPSKGIVFKDTLIPLTKLHFTMHVMSLNSDDDIEKAKLAVGRAWTTYKDDFKNNPVIAQIQGMGHFTDTVLFAKIQGEETIQRLTLLADKLREEFEALNIPGEDRPFNPHLTIAKIFKSKKLLNAGIRSYPRELWKDSEFHEFGAESVNGIQLLSMMGQDPGGYYPPLMDFNVEYH